MVGHKTYNDQSDEPLDPIEGADAAFPQTIGEELRQVATNTEDDEKGELSPTRVDDGDDKPTLLDTLRAKAKAAQGAATASGDPLSALLGRVRLRVAEDEQIKEDRRRAAGYDAGGLTKAARDALRAKILKWESAREWTPVRLLLVVELTACTGCQTGGRRVNGLFVQQTRKLSAADTVAGKLPSQRLVRWTDDDAEDPELHGLPKSVTDIPRVLHICDNCAERRGFGHIEVEWLEPGVPAPRKPLVKTFTTPTPASYETFPKAAPVMALPQGELTPEEQVELESFYSKSLAHAAYKLTRPDLTMAERQRLEELLDKANLGDVPPAKML